MCSICKIINSKINQGTNQLKNNNIDSAMKLFNEADELLHNFNLRLEDLNN